MELRAPTAEWISQGPGIRTVMIHGMTMAPGFWHSFAPVSLREGSTVAYPLPGHFPWVMTDEERSGLNTKSIVAAYAEAIERDFGGEPVTLLGHSTGAHISLLIALERPDLVSNIILAGGFGCGQFEGQEGLATRILLMPYLGSMIFTRLFSRWIAHPDSFRIGAQRCVYDATCSWATEEALSRMEYVRLQLLQSNPLDIAAMAAWLRQQSLMQKLPEIRQPVLNIIGLQDKVVPASHQLRVSRRLPNAQTILLPGSGHLPMVEHPGHFSRIVGGFVALNALKALPTSKLELTTLRRASKRSLPSHKDAGNSPRKCTGLVSSSKSGTPDLGTALGT